MSSALSLNLFDDFAPALPMIGNVGGEAYAGMQLLDPKPQPTLGNVIEFPLKPAIQVEHEPRVLEDRWYQTNALEEIKRRMPIGGIRRDGKGEMLVCPTGGGKTSIASRAIGDWLDAKKRVLILVDLERLLDQMREDLAEEGIYPLIEMAEHSALADFGRNGNCVLASMWSLHQGRLEKWAKDAFDYIVIDECHCFGYEKIVAHFECAQFIGLTATPRRTDGRSLKEFFHSPYIKTLTMREGIEGWNGNTRSYEKPFLSRVEVLPVNATHIDLTGIKMVGRDFDQRELDKRIWEHTNWLASAILKATEEREHVWVYCPKIATTEAIAKAMRDLGASCAPYHSQLRDPRSVFDRFKSGDLRYLVNVNMLIKGVNVPMVDSIVRVRASLNVAQATQEIGRGTRLSPQTGKKNCLIVEFDFKTGGKKLVGVIDSILDGIDDEDEMLTPAERQARAQVRERAETLVRSGEERDVLRAIDRAQKQLSLEEEEAKRKREEERQARYQKTEVAIDFSQRYDPFAGLNKQGAGPSEAREWKPATPEQLTRLETLSKGKIKATRDAKQFCEESADKRIQELEVRAKYKLATEPQLGMMVNVLGFDAKKAGRMKKWEASAAIEARMLEMAGDIESTGLTNKTFEELKTMKPWDLAPLHKRLCGTVNA